MGSTGSGNLSDYSAFNGSNSNQGGKGQENLCEKAFRTSLEEIDNSEYYNIHKSLPALNSKVVILFNGVRLAVALNGEEIGYLPTQFNYLRGCMEEYTYLGIITNVSTIPINSITVNIQPQNE